MLFRTRGLLVLAAGLLIGAHAWGQGRLAPYQGPVKILSIDSAARAVTVNLVAGEGAAPGLNFDGYSNGALVIRVPLGWTVHMTLVNDSSLLPHSALVVPWSERQAGSFTPAFPGAAASDYTVGIAKGAPPQQFSFTADKAGQYAVVCGVPGHDAAGMWDELDVVAGLSAPEALVAG
jgi:sulfocyanin